LIIAREAGELSVKTGYPEGVALSHYQAGVIHDSKGDYPAAMNKYREALRAWDEIEKKVLVPGKKNAVITTYRTKALTYLGNDHTMQGDFPNALKYSFEALKLATETGNKSLQASNFGIIANVFNNQKEFTKALEYYFKALDIYKQLGMQNGVAYCYIGIGNTYNDKNEFDKALEYYFNSLKINEASGNKPYIAANLGNIGSAYSRQGKDELALEYFLKALIIDEELNNTVGKAYRMSSIGAVYLKQEKFKDAERFLLKGLELSELIGSQNMKQDRHRELSELYEKLGDQKRALNHFKLYTALKDSIFGEEKNRELTKHELNYEFEKKEAELRAEQEKKDAVANADKKRQEIFFWLLASIAAAVGLIALVVFRSLQVTRKQKSIIEEQKLLVERKQKEVLDSIHYAKRIQQSLLPTEQYIQRHLGQKKH
jgi:tetratricopeptide (TPR) repeat protein